MSFMDKLTDISSLPYNRLTVIMGKQGSGKTTVAGSYPKPLLYIPIGKDGGGVVLKDYEGVQVYLMEPEGNIRPYHKIMKFLDELGKTPHPFKTILIDAYSSIEEDLVSHATALKGKNLSQDEWGTIGNMMTALRDKIVDVAGKEKEEIVLILHIKTKEDTDNISGDKNVQIIPKMTHRNGNILLERASNVMFCTRKTVRDTDGKLKVQFLTYLGAHPYIDTKLRRNGKGLKEIGVYIENCNYDEITKIVNGSEDIKILDVIDVQKQNNPFDEAELPVQERTKEENGNMGNIVNFDEIVDNKYIDKPGTYTVKVIKGEEKLSSAGKPMHVYTLETRDKETMRTFLSLSPNALFNYKNFIRAVRNIPETQPLGVVDLDAFFKNEAINKKLVITVVTEPQKKLNIETGDMDEVVYMKIAKMSPLGA